MSGVQIPLPRPLNVVKTNAPVAHLDRASAFCASRSMIFKCGISHLFWISGIDPKSRCARIRQYVGAKRGWNDSGPSGTLLMLTPSRVSSGMVSVSEESLRHRQLRPSYAGCGLEGIGTAAPEETAQRTSRLKFLIFINQKFDPQAVR